MTVATDPIRVSPSSLLWGRRCETPPPPAPEARPVIEPLIDWHEHMPDPPSDPLPTWSPSTRRRLALALSRVLLSQ